MDKNKDDVDEDAEQIELRRVERSRQIREGGNNDEEHVNKKQRRCGRRRGTGRIKTCRKK